MKIPIIVLLSVLYSCGGKQPTPKYGQMTEADLIAQKGKPDEEKKIPVEAGKVLVYPDNEKYQIENSIVTHGFKNPQGDEKLVLYWKHKFKNCAVKQQVLGKKVGHKVLEYQLRCDAQGITVIYPEGSPFVSRIVEHEKK